MVESRRSTRFQKNVMVVILATSDFLMVGLAQGLGQSILSKWEISFFSIPATLISALVFVGIFALIGLYEPDHLLGGTAEYGLVFQGCTYGLVSLVVMSYLHSELLMLRDWLLLSWVLTIFLVGAARFIIRRMFFSWRRSRGWLIPKTIVVGVSEHSIMVTRQLMEQSAGIEIVGFLDEFLPIGSMVMADLRVLGTPDQILEIAINHRVEQVILFSNAVAWETFRDTMSQSGYKIGYRLYLSPGFYEIMTSSFEVTHKALVPLLKVKPARIKGVDWLLKTALDYSLGIFFYFLFIPVNVLIALAILFTNGKPIYTRQQVLGINGEIFWSRKFRTNYQGGVRRRLDNPELNNKIQTGRSDFRIGSFLYQTGLDKLPQLWTVLQGKLSLVGPRMNAPGDTYFESEEYHPSLLTVKPGWTGPWAVWGAHSLAEEKRLNLIYIRNWTIWSDLQILFQTFRLSIIRHNSHK